MQTLLQATSEDAFKVEVVEESMLAERLQSLETNQNTIS